jgi:hypothetical protein
MNWRRRWKVKKTPLKTFKQARRAYLARLKDDLIEHTYLYSPLEGNAKIRRRQQKNHYRQPRPHLYSNAFPDSLKICVRNRANSANTKIFF